MKHGKSAFRVFSAALLLLAAARGTALLHAEDTSRFAPHADEEFFIISSVDAQKQRIVVKRPTEVTELLQVNEETAYRDEQGKAIEFKNLRAGDTVYVASNRAPGGTRIAIRIRKGPMTLEELHRRYVSFIKAAPHFSRRS